MQYKELVQVYEKLFSTSKRLEKTYQISEFLRTVKSDYDIIFLLLRGRIFPDWDDSKIGFAARMAIKAIALSSGISADKVENLWKSKGDLGLVAEEVMKKKKQSTLFSQELSVSKVYSNLKKLATLEGTGSVDSKIKLVSELLSSSSAAEAKYVIRTVLEDMRVGIGDSTIRDSIAWACFDVAKFNPKTKDEKDTLKIEDRERYNTIIGKLQEAYDVSNDWSKVFESARKGLNSLDEISLKVGNPIKVMLFPKAISYEDAYETVGKPCAWEFKYDGFRMQIHKSGSNVIIYTRRLENVTAQFPDVINRILENVHAESCILDCEAVGYDSKSGKYMPFQHISQRIKRKYEIEKISKELPVELCIFDIILVDGKSCLKMQYTERRKILDRIIKSTEKKIIVSQQIVTESIEEAKKFFDHSVSLGNEGLMAKKLDSTYKPGARIGYGMKLKAIKESLDLVIVKAEYGEGKRTGWLSSFTVACLSEDGELLEIGKVSTGLKEKDEEGTSFQAITELLTPNIINESGMEVVVKPRVIIEVGYEELQRSTTYTSGYAMRFPRFLGIREDKSLDEISSVDYIDKLFREQK